MRLGLLSLTVLLLPLAALPAQRQAKPTTLPGVRGRAIGLAFSPDGRLIAGLCDIAKTTVVNGKTLRGSEGLELLLWDARTGKKLRSIALPIDGHYATQSPVFGPGGATVAVAGTKVARIYDTKTGELKTTLKDGFDGASKLSSFSKDGKVLAGGTWGLNGVSVAVWSPPGEKPLHTLTRKKGQFGGLALSADGKLLAVSWSESESKPTISLVDAKTGQEARSIPIDDLNPQPIALSPDGKAVVAHVNFKAVLYDTKTGKARHAFSDIVKQFAFTATGKTLVALGQVQRRGPTVPAVMPFYFYNVATGRKQSFLAPGPQDVAAFAVSPDGKSLAVAGGPDVNDAREVLLVRVTRLQ